MEESIRKRRLLILHTFLCTAEPVSSSVVAHLLSSPNSNGPSIGTVDIVLRRLHAVLYTEHERVLFYHKSFSNFLFDRERSGEFWCDQTTQHWLLTESCFRVMEAELRFNIANIPSSFILDRDNDRLAVEVGQNISTVLAYSCRSWSHHMCFGDLVTPNPPCERLSEFLHLRALFWMEVMNLLGLRGRCHAMLRKVSSWVKKVSTVPTHQLLRY